MVRCPRCRERQKVTRLAATKEYSVKTWREPAAVNELRPARFSCILSGLSRDRLSFGAKQLGYVQISPNITYKSQYIFSTRRLDVSPSEHCPVKSFLQLNAVHSLSVSCLYFEAESVRMSTRSVPFVLQKFNFVPAGISFSSPVASSVLRSTVSAVRGTRLVSVMSASIS